MLIMATALSRSRSDEFEPAEQFVQPVDACLDLGHRGKRGLDRDLMRLDLFRRHDRDPVRRLSSAPSTATSRMVKAIRHSCVSVTAEITMVSPASSAIAPGCSGRRSSPT